MATILPDERPEDDKEELGNLEEITQETQQEVTPAETQATETQEDDIPEKYKGKSTAEIVRMH